MRDQHGRFTKAVECAVAPEKKEEKIMVSSIRQMELVEIVDRNLPFRLVDKDGKSTFEWSKKVYAKNELGEELASYRREKPLCEKFQFILRDTNSDVLVVVRKGLEAPKTGKTKTEVMKFIRSIASQWGEYVDDIKGVTKNTLYKIVCDNIKNYTDRGTFDMELKPDSAGKLDKNGNPIQYYCMVWNIPDNTDVNEPRDEQG